MNRKRILFVDDEAAVLDGLQNVLWKERKRWDMAFAVGGEQALLELAKSPVDVIVSDMRMPGMDGAALLTRVKDEYPQTARLMLSGHADRDAIIRALPVVHQFLAKPCESSELRVAIERTCELQRLLTDEKLRRVVGNLETLPSVPRSYAALTEAASDPDIGLADVAAIIQDDPAMSIRVLQLVNSAYFGRTQRVASILQAVNYLGLELVKGLVLSAHVFASLRFDSLRGFSVEQMQEEAVLAARIARRLLPDPKRAEEAFTAALIHDVGRVILAHGCRAQFAQILALAAESGLPSHVHEREILGVTHAEIGGYLVGVWGLPFPIVEAVAFHHRPSSVTEGTCDVLAAVHATTALLEGSATGAADGELDLDFLARVGLADQLDRWRAIAAEERSPGRSAA